jgi:hypothetical protein
MKKIFYATLATLAILGCTKTEANFSDAEQISFAPVAKYDTKAAVSGEIYSENYPFYVYANAKSDGHNAFDSKYFEKVLFEKDGVNKTGELQVYKGSTPQYWPNVNPLIFAGFTQTGNVASITPSANEVLTSLTLEGYTQPAPTLEGANDLMYFFADNSTAGYTKTTTYVDPVMKHACSWITININAQGALVNDQDTETNGVQAFWGDLKVTEVKFVNLHSIGKVTLSKSAVPSWDYTGQSEAPVVVKASTAPAKPITTTSAEFADVANNTIVLPQRPAYLSVTYTYTTPAGVAGFTETKVLPLNYNSEVRAENATDAEYRATWAAWQPGKHYTYNLTLTAEEIKIAPSTTNWDTDWNSNDTDDDNIAKLF